MACKKWIYRILHIAGLAVLALVFIVFAAVQFQQRLLRYRAEQLMADMHRIRLYQSTWADAQKLMHRWGAWGHYDGTCTASDCRYQIVLDDGLSSSRTFIGEKVHDWLMEHRAYDVFRLFGGRGALICAGFIVQDGTIWRTKSWVNVDVPGKLFRRDDYGYTLIVVTKSMQALRTKRKGDWVLGTDDQLAEHPYFKAGRPGGCEICMSVEVTYSTRTPPEEIARLTTFDFSCLTRLRPCTLPEQLLPAAKPWLIYHDDELDALRKKQKDAQPKPCDIPIWALSRDAGTALVVDVLSTTKEEGWSGPSETARIRVVNSFKGSAPWPVGKLLKAVPFSGEFINPPFKAAEHLVPGNRYIVLPAEDFYGERNRYEDPDEVEIPRCGMQPDTPENRRELEKGFAQNDNLRGPELR